MIIKVNEATRYEVETAKKEGGQIIAARADGSKIVIGGDLQSIEVIGGEIAEEPREATEAERIAELEEALAMLLSGVTQ